MMQLRFQLELDADWLETVYTSCPHPGQQNDSNTMSTIEQVRRNAALKKMLITRAVPVAFCIFFFILFIIIVNNSSAARVTDAEHFTSSLKDAAKVSSSLHSIATVPMFTKVFNTKWPLIVGAVVSVLAVVGVIIGVVLVMNNSVSKGEVIHEELEVEKDPVSEPVQAEDALQGKVSLSDSTTVVITIMLCVLVMLPGMVVYYSRK